MVFSCQGCFRQARNKDIGCILSAVNTKGKKVKLKFCNFVGPEYDCFDSTVYFMLESMKEEQRRKVSDIIIQSNFYFMPPTYNFNSFQELFENYSKILVADYLEKGTYTINIGHYKTRGIELAKKFY